METGKTFNSAYQIGRYFKYALGEIVLVVIGILIALQINNWNEKQKKILLKKSYIDNIINDLQKDTSQLNANLSLNTNQLKRIDSIFHFIDDPKTDEKSVYNWIVNSERKLGIRVINTYNANTFNLLISSGNIDLFSNEFTNNFMELRRLQLAEIEVSKGNRDFYFNSLNNINLKMTFYSGTTNKSLIKSIIKDNNPKEIVLLYINLLEQQRHTVQRYIDLTKNVKSQTESLLKLIFDGQEL